MKKHLYTSLLLLFGVVTGAFSQSMIISGGSDHAVAICDKGLVYAWGKNDKGQLCLVDKSAGAAVASPSKVNIDPNLTFSQVSAGSGGHNIALSCKSTVYCWGDNSSRQCGRKNLDYITDEPVPVYKGEVKQGYNLKGEATADGEYLGGVTYVCGTTNASMAILSDGTAVWWGKNSLLGATPTVEPLYIRDNKGNILQNVIHIMGGDDNILIIVGDSPDAQVGTVYSAGGWNGRGGGEQATDAYAMPVEIAADESGTKSSGETLKNVRTTGIADGSAFAVDGTTGYVYGWGNNGWGCSAIGGTPQNQFKYAYKVLSGEYESISGLPYLTDVKQVIGGNGCGAAITEEGYLLWWGVNSATTGNSGGIVPNSTYKGIESTCKTGPIFANYCAGVKGAGEVRVDDAISIGRGDMCDFMVNSEGRYFVWGSTNVPGKDDHYGIMGTGKVKDLSTCLKEIDIPCEKPDICPEPFMNGPKYICPSTTDSLYSGFIPVEGKEDRYFYRWKKDGEILNTIKIDDIEELRLLDKATRKADKYNKHTIGIDDGGLYEVEVLYVGTNVPCDNCPEAIAKIEVIVMEMPVDTVITEMNCVTESKELAPTSADVICFKASVNDNFYKGTQKTTWAIFSTSDATKDKDTIDVIEANGVGDKIEFCVTGDKIARSEVHDNKDELSKDTTYTIWIEDVTRFETKLLEKTKVPTTGYTNSIQNYAELITLYAPSELSSISIFGDVQGGSASGTISVTPRIYKGGKLEYGQYLSGDVFWSGKTQSFPVSVGDGPQEFKVKCDVILPANTVRGSEYILYLDIKLSNATMYVETIGAPTTGEQTPYFSKPIKDSENTGILCTGALQQFDPKSKSNSGTTSDAFNITFGKMTDYTCGRIMLTAKYGCPPCNQPDGIVKIEVDGTAHASAKDTIFLCEESPAVTLGVSGIKKAAEPTAKFDELWFLDKIGADAAAIQTDKAAAASTLAPAIAWSAAKAGTVETYYVKIRDNEKPDAAACYVFDSIYVKYYEKPVAPDIDPIAFCENATDKTMLTTALAGADFDGLTVNWYSDDQKSTSATEPDLAALAASPTAQLFYYTVVDDETGCESGVKELSVTVYEVPNDPLENMLPFCKGDATVALATASPVDEYKVTWYDSNKTSAANTALSTLAAGDYTYYYTLTSAAPQNCVSDSIEFAFKVKDSVSVTLDTTMTCGKTVVTTTAVPATADVTYTLGGIATTLESFENPTYVGAVGSLVATGSATDYCTYETPGLDLYVKEAATEPSGDLKVTYLRTDAVGNVFADLQTKNPDVVLLETGYTLNWYSPTKPLTACPTPDYPSVDQTEDVKTTYYVSRTNADGCESDLVPVEVIVYLTPAPEAKALAYCQNTGETLKSLADVVTINDPSNSGKFKLNWYDLDGTDLGTTVPSYAEALKTPGKYVYQVSQKSEDGAESSKVDVVLTVYGVPTPTLSPTNVVEYCASTINPMGSSLEVSPVTDTEFVRASDVVWYKKNDAGTYELAIATNPSLDVTATVKYEYSVNHTYTIMTTGEVCAGESVETSVTVTYVPEVTTHEVLYLKASAVNGSFANNVLVQDPTAVSGMETGATLKWYEDQAMTIPTASNPPVPTIDPNVNEGDDQIITYFVSQVYNGCESKVVPITVRISDALPPSVYEYHYCEGQVIADLKADINPQPGKTASKYSLLWYTTKPANTTTPADFEGVAGATTYPMNSLVAALDATKGVTVYTFYVAQKDIDTEAISTAVPVTITVYPKPIVLHNDPKAVCEENVNLKDSLSVQNVTEAVDYSYYSGATPMSNIAVESGSYEVDAKYTLPVTVSQYVIAENTECRGEKVTVNVQIHDLTIPDIIDGLPTTCPGTSIELNASSTSKDPGLVSYHWTGSADTSVAAAHTVDEATFVSKNLSMKQGTIYTYGVTVTAGACTKTVPNTHSVLIGDGPVVGFMNVSEEDNYEGQIFSYRNEEPREYTSCGNPIKIDVTTYEGSKDFTWSKNGVAISGGTDGILITDPSEDGETTYTVTYTNVCKATATIKVVTTTLKATPLSQEKIEMCEGTSFETNFTYTVKAGETPTVLWYREGANTNVSTFSYKVENTTVADNGQYSFEIRNRGCVVRGNTDSLKVKQYVRATVQNKPYIVDRDGTVTIPVTFANPIVGTQTISWQENKVEVGSQNPLIVSDVVADHYYDIILADPDYCPDTLQASIWVDAKLQLAVTLKDTLCAGSSTILEIDTTGTGAFRQENVNYLWKVIQTVNGVETDITSRYVRNPNNNNLLQISVSPNDNATYLVTCDYGTQHVSDNKKIIVIPAISLTVPEVPTICEGSQTVLTVTDVAPEGTSVSWSADPTIVEGANSESVRVEPTFVAGNGHKYTYNYTAIAYNSICKDTKEYTIPVVVDEALRGTITGVSEICEGESASFDASAYDATTYTWSDEAGDLFLDKADQKVTPTTSTVYTVEMTRGLCSASDNFMVTVHPNPVIESIDSIDLRTRAIILTPGIADAPFTYAVDGQTPDDSNIKSDLSFAKHVAYVTDANGCKSSQVFVVDKAPIIIPEYFSPNSDGQDDKWIIPALADVYPNAVVTIYDRYGKKLAQFLGADSNGWDGTYQGKNLPSTDYWYQVTIDEINTEYVGHFTLIRR